ncbi:hypothetical protein [Lacrimispora xylanisolvens]|uniref:hypothetical protein n=1 Tax=Lacrimispora xylanisolvens TaxID=384636 RepID=UPI002402954B
MDITSILPEGKSFAFWEQEQRYEQELHVDCNQAGESGERDGSIQKPFLTINEAASVAVPGTRIWIHGGVYRGMCTPCHGRNRSGSDDLLRGVAEGTGMD